MPQNYKLRLSDGTVLAVDHVSLRSWAADDGAMVQAAGGGGWRSLKEVLAQGEAAPGPARHT
jgi:hypothetical protein